ncbi:MAG: DUF1361 domain-containing protein [Aestuariibaculum sp.]
MKLLKRFVSKRLKTYLLLCLSVSFSLFVLMFRIKLYHSYMYLFLVWNLFLAFIPFGISNYLLSKPKINKWLFLGFFMVWILFLPNAPYIITDLIHLRFVTSYHQWLDILVICSFAINGIFLYYLSVSDMLGLLKSHFNNVRLQYIVGLLFALSSFGVFIGRYLRYNSWDIIKAPKNLLWDIFAIITKPHLHTNAWLFTFLFGLFLYIGYCFFKHTPDKPLSH